MPKVRTELGAPPYPWDWPLVVQHLYKEVLYPLGSANMDEALSYPGDVYLYAKIGTTTKGIQVWMGQGSIPMRPEWFQVLADLS